MRGKILIKAHELVNGERQKQYGSFKDNVERMQLLVEGMTDRRPTEHEVHAFFIALKLCRQNGEKWTEDTLTDLAGYSGLINDSLNN